MDPVPPGSSGPAPAHPGMREALAVWCRVAALSFGGPAGQIAVMQRILVDEKQWLSQGRFLHALNYCMLLPGPEAQQLATYVGWLLHRIRAGRLERPIGNFGEQPAPMTGSASPPCRLFAAID